MATGPANQAPWRVVRRVPRAAEAGKHGENRDDLSPGFVAVRALPHVESPAPGRTAPAGRRVSIAIKSRPPARTTTDRGGPRLGTPGRSGRGDHSIGPRCGSMTAGAGAGKATGAQKFCSCSRPANQCTRGRVAGVVVAGDPRGEAAIGGVAVRLDARRELRHVPARHRRIADRRHPIERQGRGRPDRAWRRSPARRRCSAAASGRSTGRSRRGRSPGGRSCSSPGRAGPSSSPPSCRGRRPCRASPRCARATACRSRRGSPRTGASDCRRSRPARSTTARRPPARPPRFGIGTSGQTPFGGPGRGCPGARPPRAAVRRGAARHRVVAGNHKRALGPVNRPDAPARCPGRQNRPGPPRRSDAPGRPAADRPPPGRTPHP